MKRNEDSLRTSGTTLNTPIFILQGSQKKREKGLKKIFEELIVENFHTMGKEIERTR